MVVWCARPFYSVLCIKKIHQLVNLIGACAGGWKMGNGLKIVVELSCKLNLSDESGSV